MNVLRVVFRWMRRLLVVGVLLVMVLAAVGLTLKTPGEKMTPAGFARNSSVYVTMPDGVEIAVDVWLPSTLQPGESVPALLRTTRYIRAAEPGLLQRMALGLGLEGIHPILQLFNDSGYAVVIVDARGSGASEGRREAEIAPAETADMAQIVDWIIQQSWSNGRVGAIGVSYVGTTTEMLTVNDHPAVKAVVPLFSDFDGFTDLVRPGGVLSEEFIRAWGRGNRYSDANDVCQGQTGFNCWLAQLWVKGIKPVDADHGGVHLREVLSNRSNYDIDATLKALEYVDDKVGGWDIRQSFPAGHVKAIDASKVPMQIWVSWLDSGTVDGALARYNSVSNPQQVFILPNNHGGSLNADPYKPADAATETSLMEKYRQRLAFLDQYLKGDASAPIKSSITYYTLGEGKWRTTDVWPPEGVGKERWYFGDSNGLQTNVPSSDSGSDTYLVDYTATTGAQNRWLANLSGSRDIVYPDRAKEDEKLLVYQSAPLEADRLITGAPVVTLSVASDHEDGAFHVYLEDVAPDGRVTYITEGILRATNRAVSDDAPPYYIEGPYHSLKRADAAPLVPGEKAEVAIKLITTSVRVKAGHRLRIAIAGHDASTFERLPAEGDPQLTVFHNSAALSYVDLPVMDEAEAETLAN